MNIACTREFHKGKFVMCVFPGVVLSISRLTSHESRLTVPDSGFR